MAAGTGKVVCVTGAGGFVASWLVKLLLSKGYTVRGTVRDPSDEKNAYLKRLENATDNNLQLFKADLLDYGSLSAAIAGSQGVFHTACPVLLGKLSDPEKEMVAPAVDGTLNVLKACSEAKVGRVVLVSTTATIYMDPNWPKDKIVDENCWSDKEFLKSIDDWYSFAKTIAEEKAVEYGREARLDVVTVCPGVVFGPMLQPTVNASSFHFAQVMKGLPDPMESMLLQLVDVRDVAGALLLAYEKPEATGRYICCSHMIKLRDLVDKLKNMYPKFKYPTTFIDVEELDFRLSSEKLKTLGWKDMTLDECVVDSVEHFIKTGILDKD